MVNLKYLVLFICFAQIFYYSAADNSTSIAGSIVDKVLPDCVFGVETISVFLYTRNIPDGVVLTVENLTSIDALEKYELTDPIIFLAHGFISSGNTSEFIKLSQALLKKFKLAVISIDWKQGACSTGGLSLTDTVAYPKAVQNTPEVGQYVANLTKIIIDKYNATLDKMIMIGHSLGAHVMGFAGKEIQKLLPGEKYPQIIGLDPAFPLFSTKDCAERLCKTDADFVQIMHTTRLFGISQPIGSVDFYMNKGHLQPDCNADPSCSHSKAISYLTETIEHECCFIGTPWTNYFITKPISSCTKDTCVCVGLNARDYPARGKFYVKIEYNYPYCNNNGTVL